MPWPVVATRAGELTRADARQAGRVGGMGAGRLDDDLAQLARIGSAGGLNENRSDDDESGGGEKLLEHGQFSGLAASEVRV